MSIAKGLSAVLLCGLGACAGDGSGALDELAGGPDGISDYATDDDGKADDTGKRLDYRSYDVLFTNPLCREYRYPEPVPTADGTGELTAKPANVYCTKASDFASSASRDLAPQKRLVEWVRGAGEGDEIFLAFLSFSNSSMGKELCDAATRGAKVTFVLDAPSNLSSQLEACGGEILLRGHQGSIGYAHNKIVLINPRGAGPADGETGDDGKHYMRMAFASGNMSSGVVLHHENWHFIDVARESFFAQAHVCLMDAQLSEEATSGKAAYRTALNECRKAIPYERERDISAYFIPSSTDSKAITDRMLAGVRRAASIDMGAHRFGHPALVAALADRLASDEEFSVRMVADDDLYWLNPLAGEPEKLGDNDYFESNNVEWLEESGRDRFEIRYFETNHGEHLLHHNKYLLFRDATGAPTNLLAGAANLTNTGFRDNFENIYWIEIPHVLEQFDRQYARVWDGVRFEDDTQDPPVATPAGLMPAWDAKPE